MKTHKLKSDIPTASSRHVAAMFLGIFLSLGFALPSDAAILIAEYNFQEIQPSTVVLDQVGPPYSDGTRVGGGDVNYGTLQGSQALNVNGVAANAITLGKGANDEFQALLTNGFRIQLDFQITPETWNGPMNLISMSRGSGTSGGERAFELNIFASNNPNNPSRVYLNIFNPEMTTTTAVVANGVVYDTPYQAIAEWDPTKDSQQVTVEIWNLQTSTLHGSAALNFGAVSLYDSDSPLLIGRLDQATNPNAFQGLIDNVQIYQVVPEPGTVCVLGMAGLLALVWRARQRSRRTSL